MKDTDVAYIAVFLMVRVFIMSEELIRKRNTKDLGIEKRIVGGLVWK